MSECRECAAGRSHCHGTLIQHPGQPWHCTDPDCVQPEILLHGLAIDCHALGCRCGVLEDRLAV
ncbi:MAG: hypothetical protein ACKOB8_10150 [Mycobacterium sp.]